MPGHGSENDRSVCEHMYTRECLGLWRGREGGRSHETAGVSRVLFILVVKGSDSRDVMEVRVVNKCAGVCRSVLCGNSQCRGPEGHTFCAQGQCRVRFGQRVENNGDVPMRDRLVGLRKACFCFKWYGRALDDSEPRV